MLLVYHLGNQMLCCGEVWNCCLHVSVMQIFCECDIRLGVALGAIVSDLWPATPVSSAIVLTHTGHTPNRAECKHCMVCVSVCV